MDIDSCNAVADTSDGTFLALSDLIASSSSEEQMVYRETELDELWRLLQVEDLVEGSAADHARVLKIDGVMEAHDLVALSASPANVAVAAARLRALIA